MPTSSHPKAVVKPKLHNTMAEDASVALAAGAGARVVQNLPGGALDGLASSNDEREPPAVPEEAIEASEEGEDPRKGFGPAWKPAWSSTPRDRCNLLLTEAEQRSLGW